MANTVSTRIVAKDEASAVFNNLGATLRNNTAAGVLMGNAISGAVQVATSAVGSLVGAFGEAAALQSEAIGTAGDFAKMSGMSFEEAQAQIDGFNERMSKTAASLPGATKDYTALGRGIMDNLLPAFQDINGALDVETFNESLDTITTAGALRAANAGVEAKDAALAISKALSGKSIAELSTLRFFENSPASLAFLEKESAKIGLDLKSMTARQRADVVKAALSVPDEVIEASKVSVSGLIEGFKSNLFDPSTGVFGLMRELDDGSSAFSIAGRSVALILGEDGLVAKAGAILSDLGLTSDPMEMLADGLFWVNGYLEKAGKFLDNLKNRFDNARGGNLPAFDLSEMGAKVGKFLSNLFNKGLSSIGQVNWAMVGAGVGELVASAINGLAAFVRNINFTEVAGTLLKIMVGVGVAVGAALANINWGNVGIVLLKLAGVAISALGVAVAAAIAGGGTLAVGAFAALALAVVASIGKIGDYWESKGESILTAISSFFQSVNNWVISMINRLPGRDIPITRVDRESGMESLANKASGLDQGGLFDAIARERRAMPAGARPLIANDSEAIFNRTQQSQLLAALGNRQAAPSLSIGSLIINAGQTADPGQLAGMVVDAIAEKYSRYAQSKMSPAF